MSKEEAPSWRREQFWNQNRESAAASHQQQRKCITELGAEVEEWKAKFAAMMEKLCTLEEASPSQNLPLLNDSVPELILSDHAFACPRRDPSTYGSTQSMMIS
eukprot:5476226-Ditylum_brightwellii.AAC.1